MFTALGIYSESFEKPFLECTSEFYAAEGMKYMQQADVPDYWKHVEGFTLLMDGNRIEDLQRMHTLFSIVNALESLRQALSSYIRRTGQGIIMDEEKDKEMVASLLEFKAYLDTIWEESFFKNEVFCNTIRDAFEHLINLRQNRPAELIAKFLDEKLRAGNKATSEDLKRNWRECLTKSWFYSGLYRAEIMSALKRAANGGMVEPNRVDVTQVCVNRIEQWNGMEIQASGEVEDEGIAVLQNNDTDYEIGYRPCMGNVTGFSK